MFDSARIRIPLLRKVRQVYCRTGPKKTVLRGLADPFFPMTFLVRNMLALRRESSWSRLPRRVQKARLLTMLLQRSAFFMELKDWLHSRKLAPAIAVECSPDLQGETPLLSYCTHCGGCCEIASGLADFPLPAEIPLRWQRLFGEGLGRGHRFCAFLWQSPTTAASLCAIHEYRPNPCRQFEREECEFLQRDPDFAAIDTEDAKRFAATCRRLFRLMPGR